jgi:hypothetical protein
MNSGLGAFVSRANLAFATQRMKGIDVVVAEAAPVANRSSLYFGPILIAVVPAHVGSSSDIVCARWELCPLLSRFDVPDSNRQISIGVPNFQLTCQAHKPSRIAAFGHRARPRALRFAAGSPAAQCKRQCK